MSRCGGRCAGGRRSDSSHEQLVPSFQRGRGGGRGRGRGGGYASTIRFPPRPLGTVSIDPVVHNKKTNGEMLGVLVEQYWESHLGRRRPAYDGTKSLYTGPLPFNNKVFPVKLVENDEAAASSSQSRRKEREFKVTISSLGLILIIFSSLFRVDIWIACKR